MFVDIAVSGTHDYTLALYFLDWDLTTRRVGVQMIDPETLKQLAPVKVVRDYTRENTSYMDTTGQ